MITSTDSRKRGERQLLSFAYAEQRIVAEQGPWRAKVFGESPVQLSYTVLIIRSRALGTLWEPLRLSHDLKAGSLMYRTLRNLTAVSALLVGYAVASPANAAPNVPISCSAATNHGDYVAS